MTTTATKTVTINPPKGRPIHLITGTKVTPAQLARLNQRQRDAYTQVNNTATTRHPYLMDEAVDLVGCYVSCQGTEKVAVAAFLTLNPDSLHTVASVQQAVRQLSSIDPNKAGDTKWVAKTVIIQAALETAADYFDPTGDLTDAYHLAGF